MRPSKMGKESDDDGEHDEPDTIAEKEEEEEGEDECRRGVFHEVAAPAAQRVDSSVCQDRSTLVVCHHPVPRLAPAAG